MIVVSMVDQSCKSGTRLESTEPSTMIDEVVLPKHEGEVRLPRVVGGVRLGETDRDTLVDVEAADRVDVGVVGVAERVGGAVRVGRRHGGDDE